MKLKNIYIEDYMKEYGDTLPSIGHIVTVTPRKREIKLLTHLIANNMRDILSSYLYQYTGVSSEAGYAVTFVCEAPKYDDQTEESIINMSKFAKCFGVTNKDIEAELTREIAQGAIKLGDTALVATDVGPFEPGGFKGEGRVTVRLFVKDKATLLQEIEARKALEEVKEDLKETNE